LPEFRSRWLFRRDGEGPAQEVPVSGDLVASSALALRDLAVAGMGPALLADWLIGGDIEAGRLVDLFPEHRVAATRFDTAAWLIYPNRSFLPSKVRVAIDFMRRRLR
jgi:DNA-binding transcriptional LysR family regulator